jgi:hypothetical protein
MGSAVYHVPCPRCGLFAITEDAADDLARGKLTDRQIGTISGFLHENRKYRITRETLPRLLAMRPLTLPEKGSRVLQFIASKWPLSGEDCEIPVTDPVLQVAGWLSGVRETVYIVQFFLAENRNFLLLPDGPRLVNGTQKAIITPEGWEYLDSLTRTPSTSTSVFIAMSFDPALTFLRDDAFYPTLEALGYKGFRVDDPATNDLIDDAIIAGIKRSRFIIADFTGQRNGVYYEAGFAAGLGLTVVRTCHKDEEEKLHFDTSHYPFIFWSQNDLDGLRRSLNDRIVSRVGRSHAS